MSVFYFLYLPMFLLSVAFTLSLCVYIPYGATEMNFDFDFDSTRVRFMEEVLFYYRLVSCSCRQSQSRRIQILRFSLLTAHRYLVLLYHQGEWPRRRSLYLLQIGSTRWSIYRMTNSSRMDSPLQQLSRPMSLNSDPQETSEVIFDGSESHIHHFLVSKLWHSVKIVLHWLATYALDPGQV